MKTPIFTIILLLVFTVGVAQSDSLATIPSDQTADYTHSDCPKKDLQAIKDKINEIELKLKGLELDSTFEQDADYKLLVKSEESWSKNFQNKLSSSSFCGDFQSDILSGKSILQAQEKLMKEADAEGFNYDHYQFEILSFDNQYLIVRCETIYIGNSSVGTTSTYYYSKNK